MTLERSRQLPERPPVLVVDNGSSDGSPARVADRYPEVRVISLHENLGAAARNLGVRAAATPYVAFADDDSWWKEGALARAVQTLEENPSVALIAARVLVGEEERIEPTCELMAASPLPAAAGLSAPRILGFVACGAVVRREAFLQAGGFHPRFGVGGEEALLATDLSRLGWDLVYDERLVAHHHPSPRRDRRERRTIQARNDLWFAWLRRPLRRASATTARTGLKALRDPAVASGCLRAVAGLRWVVAQRRVVPPALAADLDRLEA